MTDFVIEDWRQQKLPGPLSVEFLIVFETGFFVTLVAAFETAEHAALLQVERTKQVLDRFLESEKTRIWDDNPWQFEDHAYAEDQLRVIRWGVYLAGYSYFEHLLIDLAHEHDPSLDVRHASAVTALQSLKERAKHKIDTWDNLIQRVRELKFLRDRLAHGGGYCRAVDEPLLAGLIGRGEVACFEDGRLPHGEPVLNLEDGFLQTAMSDFDHAYTALWRSTKGR